jgi:hypothetical protein
VLVACRRNQIDHGNDLFAAVHTKAWLPKVVIPQSFVLPKELTELVMKPIIIFCE